LRYLGDHDENIRLKQQVKELNEELARYTAQVPVNTVVVESALPQDVQRGVLALKEEIVEWRAKWEQTETQRAHLAECYERMNI